MKIGAIIFSQGEFQIILKLSKEKNDLIGQDKIANQNIKKIENEILTISNDLEKAKIKIKNNKKKIDALELEAQEIYQQEQELKKKLTQVFKSREIDGIQIEIEKLNKRKEAIETELISIYENQKKETATFGNISQDNDQKYEEFKNTISKLKKEKSDLAEKIESLNKKIFEFVSKCPENVINHYKLIASKAIVNPVVEIKQDSCGACFTILSSCDIHKIKEQLIMPCNNCYRLIFFSIQTKDEGSERN